MSRARQNALLVTVLIVLLGAVPAIAQGARRGTQSKSPGRGGKRAAVSRFVRQTTARLRGGLRPHPFRASAEAGLPRDLYVGRTWTSHAAGTVTNFRVTSELPYTDRGGRQRASFVVESLTRTAPGGKSLGRTLSVYAKGIGEVERRTYDASGKEVTRESLEP